MRSIFYAIKQAFKQVLRNRTMTIASLFSITAMLLILGLFFILVVNVNQLTADAKQQFDTIQVYLLDTTDEATTQQMIQNFQDMDNVKDVTFVTRDDAMLEMKDRWGSNGYLLDGLSKNPFPNSIRVKVEQLEDADAVVAQAKTFQGIQEVKYYQDTVDKLLNITKFIQMGALIVIVFLVFVSVVVVSNTVKLTVLAREREISIMKYVGATNWFIRGPFLVEGMVIGFLSALVSVGLISLIYSKVVDLFGTQLMLLFSSGMVEEGFLIWNLVWIFLALGISIGAFGSIVSMRRFLDT